MGIRLTYYFYVIFIYYVMKKLILKQKNILFGNFFHQFRTDKQFY